MADTDTMESEWSHFFKIDQLEDRPVKVEIEADAQQRERLAQRLKVVSVERAQARLTLERKKGTMAVRITGAIEADITQSCVVTLEPVHTKIAEEIEGWFAEQGSTVMLAKARQDRLQAKGQKEFPILEESEDPEPIVDGRIDLGELATQHLSLGINPYPHAEGAFYQQGDDEAKNTAFSFKNPFSGLKDWKDKL